MKLKMMPDEVFLGGAVTDGIRQPYTAASTEELDLTRNETPNQMMPLLLSTTGHWLWNPAGMRVSFQKGEIQCTEGTTVGQCCGGLRESYLDAMQHCFPPHEVKLDNRLFTAPVYNTWIELTFHQTQDGVLQYAQEILQNDLPPGVLMIDDGWSDCYGRWQFSREKFRDPASMLAQLHRLGFPVMLWICPFVTPDTLEYRELERRGLLVTSENGLPHIAHWWNGWSALLDMTKPAARRWLKQQLDDLQALGVDGFKFDAGDSVYYPSDGITTGDEHCRAWAAFGEQYSFNEFRVTSGAGGWSLTQRLCDKDHSWGNTGLAALIPDAIVQSLTGHSFLCPDMIGGGEYRNFYSQERLDQELVVRWAQVACLMPVMQFSAAPWRILSSENYAEVQQAVALRKRYLPALEKALAACRKTGEPVLRPLAYNFTDAACSRIMDQFMIGNDLLVAPILEKGATSRPVYFPKGCWLSSSGHLLESSGEVRTVEMGIHIEIFEKRCESI